MNFIARSQTIESLACTAQCLLYRIKIHCYNFRNIIICLELAIWQCLRAQTGNLNWALDHLLSVPSACLLRGAGSIIQIFFSGNALRDSGFARVTAQWVTFSDFVAVWLILQLKHSQWNRLQFEQGRKRLSIFISLRIALTSDEKASFLI